MELEKDATETEQAYLTWDLAPRRARDGNGHLRVAARFLSVVSHLRQETTHLGRGGGGGRRRRNAGGTASTRRIADPSRENWRFWSASRTWRGSRGRCTNRPRKNSKGATRTIGISSSSADARRGTGTASPPKRREETSVSPVACISTISRIMAPFVVLKNDPDDDANTVHLVRRRAARRARRSRVRYLSAFADGTVRSSPAKL